MSYVMHVLVVQELKGGGEDTRPRRREEKEASNGRLVRTGTVLYSTL